jgi:hypothetical protein
MFNGKTYTIHLQDILYMPGNQNNLFSLGRWLANGGNFLGHNLTLISKGGNTITKGSMTLNNLIKLRFHYTKQSIDDIANNANHTLIPFSMAYQLKSWDVWHHCFGHIGYSGLKKLFNHKLVISFFIDHNSQMADCVPCTEVKQSVIPFNKKGE